MTRLFAWLMITPLLAWIAWSEAFCAIRIWRWHINSEIVPSLGKALGFFLLLGICRSSIKSGPADDRSDYAKFSSVMVYFLYPWMSLAVAWWFK